MHTSFHSMKFLVDMYLDNIDNFVHSIIAMPYNYLEHLAIHNLHHYTMNLEDMIISHSLDHPIFGLQGMLDHHIYLLLKEILSFEDKRIDYSKDCISDCQHMILFAHNLHHQTTYYSNMNNTSFVCSIFDHLCKLVEVGRITHLRIPSY
jgi:hypothetical protein